MTNRIILRGGIVLTMVENAEVRVDDVWIEDDRIVKIGETIHAGQAVCRIHARTAVDFDMAEAMIEKAVKISAL